MPQLDFVRFCGHLLRRMFERRWLPNTFQSVDNMPAITARTLELPEVVHVAFLTKYRLYLIGTSLTVFLAIVIAFLTLAPISSTGMPGSDKLHRSLAFAALAFPLPFARPRHVLPVILGVIAYGGMIEIIQPVFGCRHRP